MYMKQVRSRLSPGLVSEVEAAAVPLFDLLELGQQRLAGEVVAGALLAAVAKSSPAEKACTPSDGGSGLPLVPVAS
jgi:hypothetical protein